MTARSLRQARALAQSEMKDLKRQLLISPARGMLALCLNVQAGVRIQTRRRLGLSHYPLANRLRRGFAARIPLRSRLESSAEARAVRRAPNLLARKGVLRSLAT